jgi:uncharacterized cysteine cluster protein YcgN (CxxCxxCC family)
MKFVCSIYKDRPRACKDYPWNEANQIFPECIFYDNDSGELRSPDDQLKLNSQEEIEEYCVKCGQCCFYGPAACSKLRIIED